jgi:hypothetical protein
MYQSGGGLQGQVRADDSLAKGPVELMMASLSTSRNAKTPKGENPKGKEDRGLWSSQADL